MSLPEALSGEAGRTFAVAIWLGVIVAIFCFCMGLRYFITGILLLAKAERDLNKADGDKRRRKPVKSDCELADGNSVSLHPKRNLLLVGGQLAKSVDAFAIVFAMRPASFWSSYNASL